MKTILKLEEIAMFLLGILAFNQLNYSWWVFIILILTPDIGMLGYLINKKIGAISYNLFHHKGLAIGVYVLGIYFNTELLQLIGIILFAHASIDRVFGYGLKFMASFHDTHLGKINKDD